MTNKVAWFVAKEATKKAKMRAMVEKSMVNYKAMLRAMEANKISEAFKVVIVDALVLAFLMGFDLYKSQVAQFFSRIDIGHMNSIESEDEVEEDGVNIRTTSKMNKKMRLRRMVQMLALFL